MPLRQKTVPPPSAPCRRCKRHERQLQLLRAQKRRPRKCARRNTRLCTCSHPLQELQAAWEAAAAQKAAEEEARHAQEVAALRAAQAQEEAAQGAAKPGPRVRVSTQGVSMCTGATGKARARFELVHEVRGGARTWSDAMQIE